MTATGTAAPEATYIRSDGIEKVTGAGRYTADMTMTGVAHAKFRYADHPHARILSIDTSAARALPGVLAVVTQADLPDVRFGGFTQDRTLFAKDVVRFEAEIVAGVAATTPEIAAEAARLIEIEYAVLPAVSDFVAAMEPGSPLVHEDWASYERDENIVADGNTFAYHTIVKGDADAAMAGADVVVKGTLPVRRLAGSADRAARRAGALAGGRGHDLVLDAGAVRGAGRRRADARHARGERADRGPAARRRVRREMRPALRGAGGRARARREAPGEAGLLARGGVHRDRPAARGHRDGVRDRRHQRRARSWPAAPDSCSTRAPTAARAGSSGRWPRCTPAARTASTHINVESWLNYTNNQPSGSVRAPTAPQVCWGLEQHMDEVAAAIGMDPVELRRRTLIEEGAEGPTRQVFDEVGIKQTLERATEMIGYGQDLPEDEAIGVAVGWWPCMPAPSGAYVHINGDGSGTIVTGAQENGSGAVMALPRFVAEELGMRPQDFTILYQDTAAANWDMGSCGSQTTFNSGRAVLAAAADVREQLLDEAADRLEADRDDLELADGQVRVKGSPERAVSIADIAADGTVHGKGSGEVPEAPPVDAGGCVGRLGNESFLAPQLITQAAHVKVDRETGVVRVLKLAAAHDSGMIVNRLGADGQVFGGLVMGIGLALSEGTMLDDEGRQRNPHLLDYKLVTCSDAPEMLVDWIQIPAKGAGPRGSKGVGEPPQVPTAGAIANAIAKVLGRQVTQLPMTPERVWAAANGASA